MLFCDAVRSYVNQIYTLFQISNLMHNSFILQQYVCYTTILNMFRAECFSSSGGQIVSSQPLVSSPSVNSRTVCRLRADCSPLSTCMLVCTAVYRGLRYQRLWWYNLSSWGWEAFCSKHVEDRSVTYILLKNKGIVHYVGNLKKSILFLMWFDVILTVRRRLYVEILCCTVRKNIKFTGYTRRRRRMTPETNRYRHV